MASEKEWAKRFHTLAVFYGLSVGLFSVVFLAGFGALDRWPVTFVVVPVLGYLVYRWAWARSGMTEALNTRKGRRRVDY